MNALRRRIMVLGGSAGEDYVDLGLPSGLLWAKGNIVKNGNKYKIGKETDYGCYFSWGNVEGHNEGEGYNFNSTTYGSTLGKSLFDDISSSTYDAAQNHLGDEYRIPTQFDFKELYDNTDTEWATINGVAGRKFMKKLDHSVYVFLPASGYYDGTSLSERTVGRYWTASYSSSDKAYRMHLSSASYDSNNTDYRRFGYNIRAVSVPPVSGKTLLLMNFNNSSNVFLDSCNNVSFSRSSYFPQYESSIKKFGNGSIRLKGKVTSNRSLAVNSFTIEAWVYCTSWENSDNYNWYRLFGSTNEDHVFFSQADNSRYYGSLGVTNYYFTLNKNSWNHVAITYSNRQVKYYINGVLQKTVMSTQSFSSLTPYIGSKNTSYLQPSYIDEFRISEGVLYTSNFTPPTSPFTV